MQHHVNVDFCDEFIDKKVFIIVNIQQNFKIIRNFEKHYSHVEVISL